ncbi:MAG: sigma-70 family RNA polymerase sigma factor [Ruminococcaceae bacterium]|nr:sigma-70 family RNA polymerase sigma factor [Oscillospiraceae bacterium]
MKESKKYSDAFITENLGLVHACVKKFSGREIEYEDLYQAGCLGLVKAMDKFDENLGFKFSTYAVPVIIGEIKGLFRYGTEIKIPRELKKLSLEVYSECDKFEKEFGRAPLVSELSDKMNIPKEKISEALMVKNPVVRKEDGNIEVLSKAEESYEKKLTEKLALKEIYTKLSESEKELLYLRFFLCKSQSKTAEYFGVSQMQISRRERKILLYIRGALGD